MDMLKAWSVARWQLMAWIEKKTMQEHLQDSMEVSDLKRKVYGSLMPSEANENGLEQLLKVSWRVDLQIYFDKVMNAPSTVLAYLAYPCVRTKLQVRLAWCPMGIKGSEYEASNDSRSKEQDLELMEALRLLN